MIERKLEAIRDWLENPVTKDLYALLQNQHERYDLAIREGNYYRAGNPQATQENLVSLMARRGEIELLMGYFNEEELVGEDSE